MKAHRLGWRVGEVPALWFERKHGTSRFRVLKWLPAYLRWYGYAFATTLLRRPPRQRRAQARPPASAEHRSPVSDEWPRIKLPPGHHDLAVDEGDRARGRVHAATPSLRSITPSASWIISRSLRARRTDAFRSCGSTGRRWRPSPGNCRRAWSSADEDPAEACARELLEETGYPARAVHSLGAPASPCTGRLSNRIHSFFVETGERIADFSRSPA